MPDAICRGMYVLSCVHLSHKLSNLQPLTGALIGSVLQYAGQQPAASTFPKTRPVPYDPLHPTYVGRLAGICNGLGLKLKTSSSTHTAAQRHR